MPRIPKETRFEIDMDLLTHVGERLSVFGDIYWVVGGAGSPQPVDPTASATARAPATTARTGVRRFGHCGAAAGMSLITRR